ncbi:unnamed protein product [Ostreobium quekettii]|uniref:Protein kinase domain-containing protein n=1 Tax=Ostreobium quekettii TaxID=121088 RepID=A0A8S1JHW0_9CHLO|nr:unnamed protein product [Ostreobium quekettii]
MVGRDIQGLFCAEMSTTFTDRIDAVINIAREELPHARYHVKILEFMFLQMEKFEGMSVVENGTTVSERLLMWQHLEEALKAGRALIRKHASRLDVKAFFRTSEVHVRVEEICRGLQMCAKEFLRKGCLLMDLEEIETVVDGKKLSADRSYMYHYLSYVMEGEQPSIDLENTDPNGDAEREWLKVKAEHESRMVRGTLPIISDEGADKVQVLKEVGRSDCSTVYKGIWRNIDVAVKKFAEGKFSHEALASFYTEIEIQMAMAYPHIVRMYAISTEGLMVMELASCNLREMYMQETNMPWAIKAKILLEAARGLKFVHDQGFVHRAVKSQNFMVFKDSPGGFSIKIADLGLATVKTETRSRTGRPMLATTVMTAPEVCQGRLHSFRSDVFSLGVLMFEVLSQSAPYHGVSSHDLLLGQKRRGADPCKVPDGCPEFLLQLMRRCISPRPAQRPTMFEVLEGLKTLQAQFQEDALKRQPKTGAALNLAMLKDSAFSIDDAGFSAFSYAMNVHTYSIGMSASQDRKMLPLQESTSRDSRGQDPVSRESRGSRGSVWQDPVSRESRGSIIWQDPVSRESRGSAWPEPVSRESRGSRGSRHWEPTSRESRGSKWQDPVSRESRGSRWQEPVSRESRASRGSKGENGRVTMLAEGYRREASKNGRRTPEAFVGGAPAATEAQAHKSSEDTGSFKLCGCGCLFRRARSSESRTRAEHQE